MIWGSEATRLGAKKQWLTAAGLHALRDEYTRTTEREGRRQNEERRNPSRARPQVANRSAPVGQFSPRGQRHAVRPPRDADEKADFPVARRDPERHSGGTKTNLKPANSKARALLKKLLALAERGIDGEKASAQRKIRRLKGRFDFSAPDPAETPDLFSGSFKRSATARPICSFGPNEFEVANAVKWAIESATRIQCVYRGRELLAEASSATARRLQEIALHIASSFRTLLDKFSAVGGVRADDRGVFVMGLYDGMMNETRNAGQPLPSRLGLAKRQRGRKRAAPRAAGLHVHPYTLAVGLGKQIRFSAPVEEIAAELEGALRKCLPQEHADSPPPASKT